MAKNPERKSQHDESEETVTAPEGVEARESAVESPEQKKEREYQENTARLLEHAMEYLEVQKAQISRRVSLEPSASSLAESVPLPTMTNAREQWGESRSAAGVFQNLKDRIKRAELRFAGIENSEDLMALIHYLQQNMTIREHGYVRVRESQKDKKIREYEQGGYDIEELHDDVKDKGKVVLRIEKDIPFRASSRDEKRIVELLNKANDPVEMIARLKRFGFSIGGHTIRYQSEALRDFVASPEIKETMAKLEHFGLMPQYPGSYFGSTDMGMRSVATLVKDFALDPLKREQLDDANLRKIAEMKAMGFQVFLDNNLESATKIAEDEDAFILLSFLRERPLGRYESSYARDAYAVWDNTLFYQESGIARRFAPLIRANRAFAESVFQRLAERGNLGPHRYSEEDRMRQVQAVAQEMEEPIVQEMLQNPDYARFFTDIALLCDEKITTQSAELYAGLRQYPEAIPFLEMARELNIPIDLDRDRLLIHEILQNKGILSTAFLPAFQQFVSKLKEELGYQITLRDFLDYNFYPTNSLRAPVGGQIFALFNNPLWRDGIASGRIGELARKFGSFNINYAPAYTELLEIPNAFGIMDALEQKFEMTFTNISSIPSFPRQFKEICENEDIQRELFNEDMIAFYHHLKEKFGSELNLANITDYFLLISRDAELRAMLYEDENIEFIKETFAPSAQGFPDFTFGLGYNFMVLREIDPKFRPLIRTLAREGYFHVDMYYHGYIPALEAISENEEIVLQTARALEECDVRIDLMREIPRIIDIARADLIDMFSQFKDQPHATRFVWEHIKELAAIPKEKRVDYVEIFLKIDESPSQEIQRLKGSLLGQLLATNDPAGSYQKIENVFVKNNLPAVGKIYKVFEILHPPEEMERKLNSGTPGSPVLTAAGARRRYAIIYNDLLRAHIGSANRSLRQYIETLQNGEEVLSKMNNEGAGALSDTEQKQLHYVLEKFHTLFVNSTLGKNTDLVRDEMSLEDHYQYTRESLGVGEGQSITERIAEMFLRPLKIKSLKEVLARMREAKRIAHERNSHFFESEQDAFVLREGDTLKGVESLYISTILQNGSVAKEFLGAFAQSDQTPLDTDVSMVSAEDAASGFSGAVGNSIAAGYGDVMMVVRNRGQFQRTEKYQKKKDDPNLLEIFSTGGGRHYGIRTGFASTEIDFFIAKDQLVQNQRSLEKIYYEIAQNGWYIPVCDTNGRVIFTPNMYADYRKTFNGLDRFDGDALEIIPLDAEDPLLSRLQEVWKTKESDQEKLSEVSTGIRRAVESVLSEMGIRLKDEFDSGILGAELLDIGSTGRNTNTPGSYDFDLTLILDTVDFSRAQEIATKVKEKLYLEQDNSHREASGYYQLRAKGVSRIDDGALENPVDIDIGFAKKSDLAIFGSHDAVREKLNWIRSNRGEESYQNIVAAIVLTKELLNEGNAYKRVEHGGFGGIGVENWLLYHDGNMREAFKSFRDAAYENGAMASFERFNEKYKILNPGMNIKNLYHDNYIENLKPEGYERMIAVIESFLSNQ